MPKKQNEYVDDLRKVKAQLIVSSLQQKKDIVALGAIQSFHGKLDWQPLHHLMIDEQAWRHVTQQLKADPKLVFCHPDVLAAHPISSLFYRGMSGLSLKAAREYVGAIENLEAGNIRARLGKDKALQMARLYNVFICSIIVNASGWTLENGKRTVLATMGITLDGIMRNKVGTIAEDRIRLMVLEWLIDAKLLVDPAITKESIYRNLPQYCALKDGVIMKFSAEPDISFSKNDALLAVVEIKGGIDPAGALERYGAAKKSFEHAVSQSSKCKNLYLGGVFTAELKRRMDADRLVEKSFNIIDILQNPDQREKFFNELFHHALRLV
jgi:hypothetical protein